MIFRRGPPAVALLAACVLPGCGPDPRQFGGAALVFAAAYPLITGLLVLAVARLWCRLRGAPPQRWRVEELFAVVLAHAMLSLLALLYAPLPQKLDSMLLVAVNAAAHHAAWGLLLWRALRLAAPRAALLATPLALWPTIPLLQGEQSGMDHAANFWLLGGAFGAVPAVLAAALLLEAAIRAALDRKRAATLS